MGYQIIEAAITMVWIFAMYAVALGTGAVFAALLILIGILIRFGGRAFCSSGASRTARRPPRLASRVLAHGNVVAHKIRSTRTVNGLTAVNKDSCLIVLRPDRAVQGATARWPHRATTRSTEACDVSSV
jgi:hypothetical protein